MICTIVSIVLALILVFAEKSGEVAVPANAGLIFIITGFAFILIPALVQIISLVPLQKAEKTITPRLFDLVKKDRLFLFSTIALFLFALVNFFFAYDPTPVHHDVTILFSIWLVLLGISLDLFLFIIKRISSYLNPYSIIQFFTQEAKKSIQAEEDTQLCLWIDDLTEIASKAIDEHSISLCSNVLDQMPAIAQFFMESAKSIGHIGPAAEKAQNKVDAETALGKDADEVSFVLFYIFQRLEYINDKALKYKLEPICSEIISVLGKITVSAAKFDLTLVGYPVHYIGKLATQAENEGFPEIGVKATFTLLEVSKTILNEVDYTYADLKDPFLSIITHLEDIAKAAFKRDKKTNIKVLMQPFRDLKELFSSEKAAAHQDAPVIIPNIDRVIGEFETLEAVMKTLPPMDQITGLEDIPPLPAE